MDSAKDIEQHWLIEIIQPYEFYNEDYHQFRSGDVRLEIVEAHELEGGEAVGVMKTGALRAVQRAFRRRKGDRRPSSSTTSPF